MLIYQRARYKMKSSQKTSKNSHFVLPSFPRKTEEDFQCNGTLVAVAASGHLQIWTNKIKPIAKGCGRETADGDDVI
jgi:hypothetical protein